MAGRTAAGPGSAQVQDRGAGPGRTCRHSAAPRRRAGRCHAAVAPLAPTRLRLSRGSQKPRQCAAPCPEFLFRVHRCECGGGRSRPLRPRSSPSFTHSALAPALPATLPARGVCVSWCRVPGLLSLPLPPTPPGTPLQYLWLPGPLLNSGFVFFCRDPACESVPFKPDQVFSSQGRSIFFGPRWEKKS